MDSVGNAYVTGGTSSTNFPTTPGVFQTSCLAQRCTPFTGTGAGFVTKLNAGGTGLLYSTYLSGTNGDVNAAFGIAVDPAGNAYVSGHTNSSNFPTTAGAFQTASSGPKGVGQPSNAYVTKLNPSGSGLIYSTYLGGSADQNPGGDASRAIAINFAGNAYVTGITCSSNFPTLNPIQASSGGACDVFVTELNPSASGLVFSTFLGGNSSEDGFAIALDSAANIWVAGFTLSLNFPIANALQASFGGGSMDAFVVQLSPGGTGLVFSTYLGGSGRDDGFGIATDPFGNAYVAGLTASVDFPTMPGALSTTYAGGLSDGFISKISAPGAGTPGPPGPIGPQGPQGPPGPSGSQAWNTFLGTLNSIYTASTFTPDTAIQATRIQAQAVVAPVGCTTNAVLTLSDGTPSGTKTLTVTGAANDTGPFVLNYSSGATLTLRVSTRASGCSRSPLAVNVVVQYKAQ